MNLDECKVNLLLLGWKILITNGPGTWIEGGIIDLPIYISDRGTVIYDTYRKHNRVIRIYSYDELIDYILERAT